MSDRKIDGSRLVVWIVPVLLFILLLGGFFTSQKILLTTDAVISTAAHSFSEAAQAWPPHWRGASLMGWASSGSMALKSFLKAVMHPVLYNNLHHGIGMLLSSFALILYLMKRRVSASGISLGLLAACWLGSNFSLLYAGHTNKPFVILLFICSLLCAGMTSWYGAILWGSCVGLMFAQQPDVALFFAFFSGAYLLFRLGQAKVSNPWKWAKVLIPAAVVALLFAAGPLLSGYQKSVKGAAQMQAENKQEKWDYITQWSFPPEEMIAFVAPGYTGWRSGEPDGPYWGRMGRSAGWEQTGQGFQNFKLENTYLGLIPVAFALFALFSCRRSKHKAEILFWGAASLIALLLAFGKFFPLYSLFYKLPIVNNVRNPNKFLQVFQVCLAILTAYGADRLLQGAGGRGQGADGAQKKLSPDTCLLTAENRNFFYFLVGILALLSLWAMSLMINRADEIARFIAQGWPQDAAQTITRNKIVALWHASFMAAVLAGVFALFSFPVFACPERSRWGKILRVKNWIAAGLVLIVVADAIKLSKHYVKEMPRSYIQANALTDFLEKDLGDQRVALLSQQGIYNIWISYLLPYNRIPTFNVAQIGRMPQDYEKLLAAGSKNPLRMWRFAGVKYLLAPSVVEKQLAGRVRKVFAYDLAPAPGNGFQVVAAPTGTHAVFEFIEPVPRYALIQPPEPETDEQVLTRLADARQPLLADQRAAGSVDIQKYRAGRVEMQVRADQPCMLRIAERWNPDWKAAVDGEPVDVQRVDFICQGVSVPAGAHSLILNYSPSRLFFYMQCAGFIFLCGALLCGARKL